MKQRFQFSHFESGSRENPTILFLHGFLGNKKDWQEIIVQGAPVSPELYRSSAGRRQIEQLLAAEIADKVTKLFYKHIPDELGSRLTPQ